MSREYFLRIVHTGPLPVYIFTAYLVNFWYRLETRLFNSSHKSPWIVTLLLNACSYCKKEIGNDVDRQVCSYRIVSTGIHSYMSMCAEKWDAIKAILGNLCNVFNDGISVDKSFPGAIKPCNTLNWHMLAAILLIACQFLYITPGGVHAKIKLKLFCARPNSWIISNTA